MISHLPLSPSGPQVKINSPRNVHPGYAANRKQDSSSSLPSSQAQASNRRGRESSPKVSRRRWGHGRICRTVGVHAVSHERCARESGGGRRLGNVRLRAGLVVVCCLPRRSARSFISIRVVDFPLRMHLLLDRDRDTAGKFPSSSRA